MAVAVRFELTEGGYPSHAFEACSLGRSDTPPCGTLPGDGPANPIAAWRRTPRVAPHTPRPAPRPAPRAGG
jgi:hypothetical protein